MSARKIYVAGVAIFDFDEDPHSWQWKILLVQLAEPHKFAGTWQLPCARLEYDPKGKSPVEVVLDTLAKARIVGSTGDDWIDSVHNQEVKVEEVKGPGTPLKWSESAAQDFKCLDEPEYVLYEQRNFVVNVPRGLGPGEQNIKLEAGGAFAAIKWVTEYEFKNEVRAGNLHTGPEIERMIIDAFECREKIEAKVERRQREERGIE
ncbi:hypothetical protein QBC46DRAFT_405735 [Diplogelasinospora grovesii]|uniref:Uncharacterized protein n=1 Tax=Diplogelasinospora grovesii TaxID=303347 RepID=A0AAN6NDA5_9PEZI|nr:hypothetical protein QBC46DRAFT_405735 [Diplogelasinospora grovesii]